MPAALQRVERASRLLEDASAMLKSDPYSQPARKKLIEGARGKFVIICLRLTFHFSLLAKNNNVCMSGNIDCTTIFSYISPTDNL